MTARLEMRDTVAPQRAWPRSVSMKPKELSLAIPLSRYILVESCDVYDVLLEAVVRNYCYRR